MEYEKTLRKILKRLSKEIPIVEDGDLLESFKTIFPEASIKREDKNIIVEGIEMTAPLACNKEWKAMMLKDKSIICEIFRDFERGDILKVKRIDKNDVFVENISI